nr:cell envelope integrity protein TolA [Vibrio gallicus]
MKKDKKFVRSLVISGAVHLLLLVALIWGTNFNMSKPKPTPNMVQAVVIDPSVISQQANKIRAERNAAKKAEQQRVEKLRKQSEQLEKNRKAEEQRIRRLAQDKATAAKKAREAEQQRIIKEKQRQQAEQQAKKAEADRKQKQAAANKAEQHRLEKEKAAKQAQQKAKREAEKAAKAEATRIAKEKAAKVAIEKARKAEQLRIAKEKEAKAAAERARKEKARAEQAAKERKVQEAALNDIFSGLEQESQSNSAAKNRFIADELSRYGSIYKQMIQQKLLVEDSYRGKTCQVDLRLIATGSNAIVSDVKTISGDRTLCSATHRAIAQVNSFPLPKDPAVAEKLKSIRLTVAPD